LLKPPGAEDYQPGAEFEILRDKQPKRLLNDPCNEKWVELSCPGASWGFVWRKRGSHVGIEHGFAGLAGS
jgi:hypothetical protein